MTKVVLFLLFCFGIFSFVLAKEPTTKIFIASDFHLFPQHFDFNTIQNDQVRETNRHAASVNQRAYNAMLKHIVGDPDITAVILNGDIYQAGILSTDSSGKFIYLPVIASLDDESRVDLTIEALFHAADVTRKEIFFNLGNHDLKIQFAGETFTIDYDYAAKFKARFEAALNLRSLRDGTAPSIHLVGIDQPGFGNFHSIFELKIGGKKIKISHAPSVTTKDINFQAELFREFNKRAFVKVTHVPLLESNESGDFYIFGDTHTPAADNGLKVFNSGALAFDITVPFKTPTFMILDGSTVKHYTFDTGNSGKIVPFIIPRSGVSCNRFYL